MRKATDLINIKLDYDSGQYANFGEFSGEPLRGDNVAAVPAAIWARYQRLSREVMDLENMIEEMRLNPKLPEPGARSKIGDSAYIRKPARLA